MLEATLFVGELSTAVCTLFVGELSIAVFRLGEGSLTDCNLMSAEIESPTEEIAEPT
jgi:hypothetical protein